ncbi:MAG: Cof-type HAD-IIB family hydrolase [Breznakia sp.]
MYKLICIDLDGTLLNSKGLVTTTNKQAIRHALDEGVQVAIVSGRPNCFTIRIMNQISGRMGHITFNGAYYRISNKTRKFPIDRDVVKQVARLAKQFDVRVFFKNKNLSLCTKDNPHIFDYDQNRDITPIKDRMDFKYNLDVEEYLETHDFDTLKIFSYDDNVEQRKALAKEVEKLDYLNFYSYSDTFEASSDKASKGKGIIEVCADLGIEQSEVVCIGDNFNDISMFAIGGLSVAMGNAPEKIKEICDKVTLTNNEDGVAYAIENFVLKGSKS